MKGTKFSGKVAMKKEAKLDVLKKDFSKPPPFCKRPAHVYLTDQNFATQMSQQLRDETEVRRICFLQRTSLL